MLPKRGYRIRAVASTAALSLTLAGTIWGGPDHFPFTPFSQFSGRAEAVSAIHLEGFTTDGRKIDIAFQAIGLRRAEIEQQINRLDRDPDRLLRYLAEAYERFDPRSSARLKQLRLERRIADLESGRPLPRFSETLAVWEER